MSVLGVQLAQLGQGLIQRDYVCGPSLGCDRGLLQKHFLDVPATFCRLVAAAVIEQDAAHDCGRNSEELAPIFPLDSVLIDQAKISLMHQRGRLQGVIAALLPHVVTSQTTQFRVQQRSPFILGPVLLPGRYWQAFLRLWMMDPSVPRFGNLRDTTLTSASNGEPW